MLFILSARDKVLPYPDHQGSVHHPWFLSLCAEAYCQFALVLA